MAKKISTASNKINVSDEYLRRLLDNLEKTPFSPVKVPAVKNYEEYDNKNEPILYIVLNKDVLVDKGVKMTAISHLTSLMSCKEMLPWSARLWNQWLDSFDGYGNTVILEADEDTIYDNCMSDYNNIEFVKLIDDSTRVAHHNWKLDCPQHVGFAFFGIKKEMPKWIRKLPLYK